MGWWNSQYVWKNKNHVPNHQPEMIYTHRPLGHCRDSCDPFQKKLDSSSSGACRISRWTLSAPEPGNLRRWNHRSPVDFWSPFLCPLAKWVCPKIEKPQIWWLESSLSLLKLPSTRPEMTWSPILLRQFHIMRSTSVTTHSFPLSRMGGFYHSLSNNVHPAPPPSSRSKRPVALRPGLRLGVTPSSDRIRIHFYGWWIIPRIVSRLFPPGYKWMFLTYPDLSHISHL